MRLVAIALLAIAAPLAFAATPNNDDSCDISALPAATLLLPYFEVDIESETGENTLFTITNVTQLPQIARVTLWTDWAYPVYSFDVFLTGYDVQSISLLDVLRFGSIARPSGTSSDAPNGPRSLDANPLLDVSSCAANETLRRVPPAIAMDVQSALTAGRTSSCGTMPVGSAHAAGKAIGYATIDVVKSCSGVMPSDTGYFANEILFDNVLTGDYQQLNAAENYAQGGTMVHIRAIPEGSAAAQTSFATTFYSRMQPAGSVDRRQPLPSTFAARWITGGSESFATSFKIWREGKGGSGSCAVLQNERLPVLELVRFDEDENPVTYGYFCEFICSGSGVTVTAASRIESSTGTVFPPNPGGDVAGWMYINQSGAQSWVITSMAAEGRFSVDVDATPLGNGCSPAMGYTAEDDREPAIGPAPNENIRPAGLTATTNNDDSCDIAQLPAATLLLPYFEVDTRTRERDDTIFTITNVTQQPQIARVTIWTDRSYPVLTFNLFLTGYDVESISLYDVIAAGHIAPPDGTSSDVEAGVRSWANDENAQLDISNCNRLATTIPAPLVAEVRAALTTGTTAQCGSARIGNTHADGLSRGYVTIDLVDSCATTSAIDAGYLTGELLHENVLTGDYQQIRRDQNFAQSGALVHIRAIPEGGASTGNLARTFYSRYQAQGATADRRQPLPSTFVARWISGGPSAFDTSYKIWRETTTGVSAGCAVAANASVPAVEFVRFDEDENAFVVPPCPILCPPNIVSLPATSRVHAAMDAFFPPNPGTDVAGWMYLNLDDANPTDGHASQNWVVVSMEAAGLYSVDFEATALGNGCSRAQSVTAENGTLPAIGPAD